MGTPGKSAFSTGGRQMLTNSRHAIGGLALVLSVMFASPNIRTAKADGYVAPDVVVLCESTLQPVIGELGTLWRQRTGVPVRVFASPTALILEQIAHGVRSDLIIAEGDTTANIALQRHLIKAETRFSGWRNRLVVARRGANATVAVLSPQSNLLNRAGAGPVAIVDPAVATIGVQTRSALEALGMGNAQRGDFIGVASTEDATFLLNGGVARLALVYATDIPENPTLSVAATFPDDAYPPIVYWGAETRQVRSPNADGFAGFLRQPEAQARLTAAGLEVATR